MSLNNITENEMKLVLTIFKNPKKQYNTSDLARSLNISSMGALKITKKLEKENILTSTFIGKSKIYRLNIEDDYVREYVKFMLKREANHSSPYIKVWLNEIKKIKAEIVILFGSILKKKSAKDIDVLIVTNQESFEDIKNKVKELNDINIKKIHPLYQSKKDLESNIKNQDKVVLSALKGIVALGEEELIELI